MKLLTGCKQPLKEHKKVSDLGLEHGATIEMQLVSARVFWGDRPPMGLNGSGSGYVVIYELVSEDEDEDEYHPGYELFTSRSVEKSRLDRGMEWQWNFWFNVSANKSLRFELWEASSIFGHTLLAQGMLDVSNVAIDTLAPTTRIEVQLEIPTDDIEVDNIGEEDAFITGGMILLDVASGFDSKEHHKLHRKVSDTVAGIFGNVDNLGTLQVTIEKAKAMVCRGKTGYMVVKFGGQEQRIDEVAVDAGASIINHTYNVNLTFAVHDLYDDIKVKLYESSIVRRSKLVGQIIIPLATLIGHLEPVPPRENWYEIFPPVEDNKFNRDGQYRTAMQGTTAEGYGLPRPEQRLGFIQIKTGLELNRSTLTTYLLSPFLTNSGGGYRPLVGRKNQAKVSMPAIRHNMRRMQRQLMVMPVWSNKVVSMFKWKKNPKITGALLLLYTYMWWLMPFWQLPLIIAMLTTYISYAAAIPNNFDYVYIYQDEAKVNKKTSEIAGFYKDALKDRYMKYKAVTHKVQYHSDRIASTLEKIANLFAWSDWHASIAATLAVSVVACIISIILFVFQNRLRELFFYGGLTLFFPKRKKPQRQLSIKANNQRSQSVSTASTANTLNSMYARTEIGTEQVSDPIRDVIHGGFLFSKDWAMSGIPLQQMIEMVDVKWQGQWCELWKDSSKLHVYDRVYGEAVAEKGSPTSRKEKISSFGSESDDSSVGHPPSQHKVSKMLKDRFSKSKLKKKIDNHSKGTPTKSRLGSSAIIGSEIPKSPPRHPELDKNESESSNDTGKESEISANTFVIPQSPPHLKTSTTLPSRLTPDVINSKYYEKYNVEAQELFKLDLRKAAVNLLEKDVKIEVDSEIINMKLEKRFFSKKGDYFTARIIEIRESNPGKEDKVLYVAVQEGSVSRAWMKALHKAKEKNYGSFSMPTSASGLQIPTSPGGSVLRTTVNITQALAKLKKNSAAGSGLAKLSSAPGSPNRDSFDAMKRLTRTTQRPWSGAISSLRFQIRKSIQLIARILRHLVRNTPDSLDLEHRYICSRQVVREDDLALKKSNESCTVSQSSPIKMHGDSKPQKSVVAVVE